MKRILNLISLITLTSLAIGITFSATIFLEPSDGELILDCPNPIQIRIDTNGKKTNTVDSKIIDNPELPITEISADDGVFDSYIKKLHSKVRQGKDKGKQATYIMGSSSSANGFAGRNILATIYVTPQTMGEQTLEFYLLPNYNGDDSNITIIQEGKAEDLLDKASGGTYRIVEGICKNPQINKKIPELTTGQNLMDLNLLNLDQELQTTVEQPAELNSLAKPTIKSTNQSGNSKANRLRETVKKLLEKIVLDIIS